jgi:hypothetical protein
MNYIMPVKFNYNLDDGKHFYLFVPLKSKARENRLNGGCRRNLYIKGNP